MIVDHLSVGVDDIDRAANFYESVLGKLGIKQLAKMDRLVAYGTTSIEFIAMKPFDGKSMHPGNGVHIAFNAQSPAQVDAFHAAALAGGGVCEGKPGKRDYPHRQVYAAYVRDPFGNKLEALTDGFSV